VHIVKHFKNTPLTRQRYVDHVRCCHCNKWDKPLKQWWSPLQPPHTHHFNGHYLGVLVLTCYTRNHQKKDSLYYNGRPTAS